MATYLIQESTLSDIADSIRDKNPSCTGELTPLEMPSAIENIQTAATLQEKSVTPSETIQNVVADSGYDGLSKVSVNAVSSTYVGSGVTRQGAKTVTPTKSSQTAVVSGVYTTGTISVGAIPSNYIDTSDANATNIDIVNGKTAYINGSKITGQLVIQKYYTGSTNPSSSLGNNGDIYLKV